jgi:N-acetylglucosaminyl-diphospho-decaprenol L-rhamnosyltransferase
VVNVEDDAAVAKVAAGLAVALPANPGYAAAVNLGAALAHAPVVVFLNDDVRVDADAVLSLAATVSADEADVVLPRVLDGDGRWEPTIAALPRPVTLFREWFLLPDQPPSFLHRRPSGVQKWRAPVVPERIDAAAATVVAVSTPLLREIPLPEDYFLYWEESEWFWRLKAAGSRVLYDPRVTVQHAGGRDDVRLVAVDGLRSLAGSSPAAARFRARADGLAAAVLAWREV